MMESLATLRLLPVVRPVLGLVQAPGQIHPWEKKKKKMLSTNRVLHLEKGLSFSLWLQHVCHFFSGPPHKARLDKHIYLTSCDNLKKLCQKDAGLLCLG